ncbi:MAG: toxin HicA [Thermodesulfobacteriota bacterium]
MDKIKRILMQMKKNPQDIRFADLCQVCQFYFGEPRQNRSSHKVYKTPWPGDPRINIQNDRGRAKAYQVKQVLLAIDKLENDHAIEK